MDIPDVAPVSTPVRRVVTQVAKSAFGIWMLRTVAPHVDPPLLRLTRGRLSMVAPFPALLLTHTGAKSGVPRTSTLVYFTDQGRVIVLGSNFGSTRHPAWYHNVVANPEVTIDAGRFTGRFTAEEVFGAERDRLFARAQGAASVFRKYQDTAGDRLIPVVAFRPVPGGSAQ